MRTRTVTAALLLAALTACGSDDTPETADTTEQPAAAEVPDELVVTGGFFDEIRFRSDGATCRASRSDPARQVVRVSLYDPHEVSAVIEVPVLEEPATYALPVDRETFRLSYSAETDRASTAARVPKDAGQGQVEVLEASCDPARLRVRVEGPLGRLGGGRPLTVSGGIDAAE